MKRVLSQILVREPEDASLHTFAPGDILPEWAEGLVTNPKAVEEVDGDAPVETADEGSAVEDEAPASDSAAEPSGDDTPGEVDSFDPADKKVEEVLAYLETVDAEERDRVLAAELEGKARKTVLSWEPESDAESDADDLLN